MPFIGGRYMDEDEYFDARREAAQDAYYESLDEHGWTCESCGERWDPGERPATRRQPAEVVQDCCPSCGGEPRCDEKGYPLIGAIEEDEAS